NYSVRNQLLIYSQRPGATAVGSFKKFKDMGYSVQKGEKGIKVLVPVKVTYFKRQDKDKIQLVSLSQATKEEKQQIKEGKIETKAVRRFKLGTVFEALQTNMPKEKYPELYPNRHFDFDVTDPQKAQKLEKGLSTIAQNLGVEIRQDLTPEQFSNAKQLGNAKGAFIPDLNIIVLNPKNTSTEKLTTLIHELGHAAMHSKNSEMKDVSSPIKELQAELTSYSVAKSFGIDTSKKAIKYISDWTNKGQKLAELPEEQQLKILEKVGETAQEFCETIDPGTKSKEREKKKSQTHDKNSQSLSDVKKNEKAQKAKMLRAKARALSIER
ncbi:ImmA/IrrE family metallo-endopeptidase, partial [Lactobacillus sp. XV13L]|nr:ImmA/IrrE family metallo-endopeptidase [Lactobacillus sp. XV13L]